jgi:lipopolysaccharide heptosyltransferase II
MQYKAISNKEEILHVAVWMPSWIGDVVLALPALQNLREIYPNTRITAIVKFSAGQLLSSHNTIVDTVLQFPKNKADGYIKQCSYALGLRKYKFDLGIIFPNSFHAAFMLMLMGVKVRIGYRTDGRQLLLTHSIPVTQEEKKELYRVNYFQKILSTINSESTPGPYDSKWTKSNVPLKKVLQVAGVDKKDFLITVHPGASKIERAWHAERFGILCQNLIKAYPVKIILLGTFEEKLLLEKISSFCSSENMKIVVKLDLAETTQLLKASQLFIGNDSGLLHVASLGGTPVVGIFGPGQAATTGPFIDIKKKEIVTRNYSCSPCRQRFFKECEASLHQKPECLESISVKEVSEAIKKIVKRLGLFKK